MRSCMWWPRPRMISMPNFQDPCPLCGRERERKRPSLAEMRELFQQTPIEVWREYDANDYLWHQMIMEEFSNA
jgi:hypothetical protein